MNTKKILALLALSAAYLPTFATGDLNLEALLTGSLQAETAQINIVSTSIVWVETLDASTLVVRLGSQLPGISADSDAKILEDISVASSKKSGDNLKKIDITLNSELVLGTNYSIISVSEWLDSSIDFTFSAPMVEIKNTMAPKDVGIDHIVVKDTKNIEVYLNKDATLETYEFKVFKEMSSSNMFLDTTNINVQLSQPILPNTDYILILNLKDIENKDIEVENSLFDFVSGEFAAAPVIPEVSTGSEMPVAVEVPVDDPMATSGQPIENVAMEVTQTPDTGAQTNVLLAITFLLTLGIFVLRRKSFKM